MILKCLLDLFLVGHLTKNQGAYRKTYNYSVSYALKTVTQYSVQK